MSTAEKAGFRADINGLRAWAVLAVILFHFGIPGFSGGYVGVDIFFVISGFLMTGIISRALHNGAAATPALFLWQFFLARGKRIWPALIVLCIALLVVGWFLLSASEFATLGAQANSAVLFFSNIKLWREMGYFTPGAHNFWLLHTWSLSVEWQFYLLLPVAMLLAWKIRPSVRALMVLLVAGGTASLVLCLVIVATKPDTAFFLLPCRAWEMCAGGIVALSASRPRAAWLRNGFELGGLALLAVSILAFGHLAWPDWHAIVPVLGTVMVLYAAKDNSVLTNCTPLRWIGARSYSLYLWHWPLVVWLHYLERETDPAAIAVGMLLTLSLGHLSYHWVENRLRRPLEGLGRPAVSAALAAATLAVIVPGMVIQQQHGFAGRLPTEVNRMFTAATDRSQAGPDCAILQHGTDEGCQSGGRQLGLIVLGDSHANALFDAARDALPDQRLGAMRWTMDACPTMSGAQDSHKPGYGCDRFMAWALNRLATEPAGVPVLIINRSSMYAQGYNEADSGEDANVPSIYFKQRYASRTPEFYREIRENLIATACTVAKQRPVYLMRPIPEMKVHVPTTIGRAMLVGRAREITVDMDEYQKRHAFIWEAQDAARAQCGVTILDPLPYLCSDGRCRSTAENRSLYYDDDHLSRFGASRLAPMFATIFARNTVAAGH